jgi:hypothetical protein
MIVIKTARRPIQGITNVLKIIDEAFWMWPDNCVWFILDYIELLLANSKMVAAFSQIFHNDSLRISREKANGKMLW